MNLYISEMKGEITFFFAGEWKLCNEARHWLSCPVYFYFMLSRSSLRHLIVLPCSLPRLLS